MYIVKGNSIGFYGDMHIEDLYRGAHVNYTGHCYDYMERVTAQHNKKGRPDIGVGTGDIFGVRNGVSKVEDRNMLYRSANWLKNLSENETILNEGNHDQFGNTENNDYLMLARMGFYKIPEQFKSEQGRVVKVVTEYLDEDTDQPYELYLHFVPYGCEFEKLHPIKNAINIAVTHGDFRIGSFCPSNNPEAIELSTHEPFYGMDAIVNGHIHKPCAGQSFTTPIGTSCMFYNLGSLARVKKNENHDMALSLVARFVPTENGYADFEVSLETIDLTPASEIFVQSNTSSAMEQLVEQHENAEEELEVILDSLRDFTWSGVSLSDRVDILVKEPEVKDLVKSYLKIN